MKKIDSNKKKWTNEHHTFTEKIKKLYILGNETNLPALERYNDTTKGLLKLVDEAIETGTPLRALGGGWSWTKIATVKDGIMYDTKQLNVLMTISAGAVVPEYTGDVTKLIFAQCGIAIWQLNIELRKRNLSLKTCGASNGQTIVGAMSTGTHGSRFDVGGVQDYILGMHIIVGPDRHIWLERASNPIASDSFIKNLQTELVRDDELFNAALVSFGSFGIIHGVLMETEELFLLETFMSRVTFDDQLKHTMSTLDFSNLDLPFNNERPFHFGLSINPYDLKNGAYVYTYYKRPYREDYDRPVRKDGVAGPGDDAPAFIGNLANVLPALVPVVVTKFLGGRLEPFENKFGIMGEIFDNTNVRGKVLSTALGIKLSDVTRVTDLLLEVNKTDGPFLGIFAYRFVKKTEATLGFTHFSPFTCIVEFDGVFSETTLRFYEAVWNKLDELGIEYTFHWGKMTNLDAARIADKYGENREKWIAARNKLLGDSITVFNSPLLHEWGLDEVVQEIDV